MIILSLVLAALFVACFLFRDRLLLWALARVQTRVHDSYRAQLTVSGIGFSGWGAITLKDVTILPDGSDTFLRVGEAKVRISLINMFRARIVPEQISVAGAVFTIYNEEGRNNISFLRAVGRQRQDVNTPISGFRDRAADWEAKLFRLLNTAFAARNVRIFYQDSLHDESVYIPAFSYDLHKLSGLVINEQNADTVSVYGTVLKNKEAYHCAILNLGNDTAYLPFLDGARGPDCRFHSISADIRFNNSDDACRVDADVSLADFHFYHWRLANADVILPQASFHGQFTFTDGAVEMDSSSVITLGTAPCHLFARYDLQPDTTITLALRMPEIAADTFFQSLPQGMFGTLSGISCSGTLAYDLKFAMHTDTPDSLRFYSSLKQKGLHIRHYGAVNYTLINGPFLYDAYEKDRLVRRITIGTDNTYFTPLDQMSPYLAQAVLQAEDPSFMQHRGFYADAFRESIAKNYKERRFARGGSTLSMQLVKNVFLSRDKTISRKAEEALIVYLIENLGLVPKERMLEVYLNVIEWGPNVYGIGEAAKFYFSKRPSQLTLPECLFLASIIPRPKSFRYQFNKEGQLRASLGSYFRILSTRMVWRGVLDPSDTIGLRPEVTLHGAALRMVMPRDSLAAEGEEAD